MADVEHMAVRLTVSGTDGFTLESVNDMTRISRPPSELVRQAINRSHQYPDGLMLFLGTMFAPVEDRGKAGMGFTHHVGDTVTIGSRELGSLVNKVEYSDVIPEWTFGIMDLFRNLAGRGLG
jgi:fumarylacetoacetate (FAA) hydrolase family protein